MNSIGITDKDIFTFVVVNIITSRITGIFLGGQIINNKQAISDLNEKKEGAGEYMRESLTIAKDFMDKDYYDLKESANIADDYDKTIKRFFEGDVAMMVATGNTVSGTEKRQDQSQAFKDNPFTYSFHPIPSTEQGGYFYNTVDPCFSLNKTITGVRHDMAVEFMRYIVTSQTLNRLCKAKRMITPSKDFTFDSIYSAFGKIPASRTFTPSQLGLSDTADTQVRKAGRAVCLEGMSVDEAVQKFGKFE